MREIKDVIRRIKPDASMLTIDFVAHYLFYSYSEYFRKYHNCEQHIWPMLDIFDADIRELCQEPDLVEFAWWYHDFVYVPGSPYCEEVSAERAKYDAMKLKFEEPDYNLIKYLVLATKHDEKTVLDLNDEKIIHDLDLVILASEPERYDEYAKQIREEYFFVYEHDFAKGRLNILEQFLKREQIYCHLYFHKKYEKKARKNLKNEISFLKNRVNL